MTKGISGTPKYDDTMNYTITFPLPDQWQTWNVTKDNMKVYSKNYTSGELEELSIVKIKEDNGVKCVVFKTWHFSPFVLTFNGTVPDNNNNGGNSGGGGTSGGGSSSGGDSSGGGSSSGGSSSGGGGSSSDSGTSGGGSSNGSSSGSGAASTGNGAAGTGTTTPDMTQMSTQPSQDGSGQPSGTNGNGNGTGSGSGAGHVKDSTPKTGDPLEYRTLLVCGLFSMGVLLLLIGNKKKASAFSQYRRV